MNDEEQPIEQKAHTGKPVEFPEPVRVKPEFQEQLPHSDDKKFWGDAQINKQNKEEIERQRQELFAITGKNHKPMMQGREFICTSCPYRHSLPIDPNKYTMDHSGNVIPIDNTASN